MAESNKTEQATEQRRKKAREKGQVARSRELPGLAASAAVMALLMVMAPTAITYWQHLLRSLLNVASTEDLERNGPVLFFTSLEVLRWIVPALLVAMAASLLLGVAQGGVNLAPAALTLRFERFNPAAKLGQLFSLSGLSSLLKSLIPFAVMAWIAIDTVTTNWAAIVGASDLDLRPFAKLIGSMMFGMVWKSALVLLAWALIDYWLTRRKFDGDMKMTKQEIRQEHKETDGNPQVKVRIRQLRKKMRKQQTLKAAASATVVVTNPTHYAVALQYESEMDAPRVVAKGLDLIAQQIKEIARLNGVMLVENRPLAQALYKTVEVGDAIPANLYQTVAEVLVLVYKAQADVRKREAERRSRDASGRKPEDYRQAGQAEAR